MILLTGASGYLGRAVLPALSGVSEVVTAGRSGIAGVDHRPLDLARHAGFRDVVAGIETLVHLAGLAHNSATAADYEQINVRASMALADAAMSAGVKRFIYVSSLNVVPPNAHRPDDPAQTLVGPESLYAASKWRAERSLATLLTHSGCELVIVRPALVYDRELTANLATLRSLVGRFPLLLPDSGPRAMISRDDLVRLLVMLASTPFASSHVVRTLAALDGEVYTARRIGRALGLTRGLPLPAAIWRMAAGLRDRWSNQTPGSTWQSLAGEHWQGAAVNIPGWQPGETLESVMAKHEGRLA